MFSTSTFNRSIDGGKKDFNSEQTQGASRCEEKRDSGGVRRQVIALAGGYRRVATADFSRGFQPTVGVPFYVGVASATPDSGVADATRYHSAIFRGLKPTA